MGTFRVSTWWSPRTSPSTVLPKSPSPRSFDARNMKAHSHYKNERRMINDLIEIEHWFEASYNYWKTPFLELSNKLPFGRVKGKERRKKNNLKKRVQERKRKDLFFDHLIWYEFFFFLFTLNMKRLVFCWIIKPSLKFCRK